MKSVILKITVQVLIVGLILAGLVVPGSYVSASMRSCHTDPKIFFADGTKLTVTSTVDIDQSSITSVVYTVHAPVGSKVTSTVFTAGGMGGAEKVVMVADQKPGVYVIDTFVTTKVAGVHVSTNSSLKAVSGTADGTSGSHLLVILKTS